MQELTERLTEWDEYGNANIIALSDMMPELYNELSFSETNALTDVLNKLAHFEDLEEQGRLVELPCKVGDVVYAYCDTFNEIGSYQIDAIQLYWHDSISFEANWTKKAELMDELDFDKEDIGKTVFLSAKEAEEALEALGDTK